VGAPIRCEAPEKNLGRAPLLFGSKITISRFGEPFRDGQHSLVSFLFAVLLLTVPPCPDICKSGGTCPPPCPMESAQLVENELQFIIFVSLIQPLVMQWL